MAAIGPAPHSWFWSHDIQPDQIADLTMPGMRLRRPMSYRRGAQANRRFAAFYYDDDGAVATSRSWLIDVDAATAVAHGPRAVSVSVDVVPDSGVLSYTLVLENQPARVLHADLDADGVTKGVVMQRLSSRESARTACSCPRCAATRCAPRCAGSATCPSEHAPTTRPLAGV
jgi:hypothetical protein